MVIFVDNLPFYPMDNHMWLSGLLSFRVRCILRKEGVENIPQMWDFLTSLIEGGRRYPRNWGSICTDHLHTFLLTYTL
jgi:hypothetical protein